MDDEATVREVVGQYVQIKGYSVLLAANGLEALRQAEAIPPDLVSLDLTLPDMDGLDAWR
ncbi:MAG TPA: response regulator [Ktedonobacterales bacterium]|nr:response regulator [Ktedonobacterales bacterium]